MTLYYKVKTGFEKGDVISIDETELIPALKAQSTGKIAMLKNGSVAGNNIISILIDWDKADKTYNPSGEDFILPSARYELHLALENAEETVKAQIENRPPQLRLREENPIKKHTDGLTSLGDLLTN